MDPDPHAAWWATLREVRRQVKHLADASGLGSLVEGQSRLFDGPNETWEAVQDFDKIRPDGVWQEQQWQNALELLLWETPERLRGGMQQDDLIYFVLREQTKGEPSPLFVRRKAKALPTDLSFNGINSPRVSWVRSLTLNLVLQTAFRLTVTVARRGQIMGESVGGDTIDRAEVPVVVVGDVYASPSRIQVQGGRREAGGEAVVTAYPDICFAVDDSHTGFDTLLLRQAGHTLQVELSAHQGIALHANDPDPSQTPPPEAAGKAAEEIVWGAEGEGSEAEGVSLLKGFVSYEQLAEYMESGGNLSAGRKRDEEHTISMRGPGGQGRALVIGRWVKRINSGHLVGTTPPQQSQSSLPIVSPLLGRLKTAALRVLPGGRTEVATYSICCSMLEVTMPVNLLASMILRVPLKASAED